MRYHAHLATLVRDLLEEVDEDSSAFFPCDTTHVPIRSSRTQSLSFGRPRKAFVSGSPNLPQAPCMTCSRRWQRSGWKGCVERHRCSRRLCQAESDHKRDHAQGNASGRKAGRSELGAVCPIVQWLLFSHAELRTWQAGHAHTGKARRENAGLRDAPLRFNGLTPAMRHPNAKQAGRESSEGCEEGICGQPTCPRNRCGLSSS